MNTVPFVDLKVQYQVLKSEMDEAIRRVFEKSQFILGEEVRLFEEEFAKWVGSSYAIGVASGTDALTLSLRACGIGPGDEVITPTNTYIATVMAISQVGATPILVDIEPESFHLDVAKVSEKISPRTKAILPVHLYGRAVEMSAVLDLAKQHRLHVIEDSCQAHGTLVDGARRAGSLGDLGCFSFYPSKNLGAYGDGGMVVTHDPSLAHTLRLLRDYGQEKKNNHLIPGFNSRLDTLQAAILRIKLRHLEEWNQKRKAHAALYNRLLEGTDLVLPSGEGADHIFHLYVVRTQERDRMREALTERGIETGIHYPIPIHLQLAYRDLGYRQGDFPVAEKLSGEILSFPMFPELTEEQIFFVVEQVKRFLGKGVLI